MSRFLHGFFGCGGLEQGNCVCIYNTEVSNHV